MSTEALYYEDSYIREFNAKVVRSGPKYAILDRTAFYPEGGGQPCDTGTLIYDSEGVEVFKVMKRGPYIYHYLRDDIPQGVEVTGKIDWNRRFWNMRRHSAEHLLTGLLDEEVANPKIYSDLEKLEYRDPELDERIIEKVEALFNDIIDIDLEVSVYYKDRDEIHVEGDPRKKAFLEKIPSNVKRIRMVEIGGYASTFCMGTHVKSTGDIGHLKNIVLEKGKNGRKVIHFALEP